MCPPNRNEGATKPAAKRRKNAAHGVSRACSEAGQPKLRRSGRKTLGTTTKCSTKPSENRPKTGISSSHSEIPHLPCFPQCGKLGLNPTSSPSLLGIQPIVFPP